MATEFKVQGRPYPEEQEYFLARSRSTRSGGVGAIAQLACKLPQLPIAHP